MDWKVSHTDWQWAWQDEDMKNGNGVVERWISQHPLLQRKKEVTQQNVVGMHECEKIMARRATTFPTTVVMHMLHM